MEQIVNITEENFETEILKAGIPAVVDFTAEWCTFCKRMEPVFEQAAQDYEGRVRFGVVNVDEQKKLAITNKVAGIPALLFYKNGVLADRVSGALNTEQFQQKLNALL